MALIHAEAPALRTVPLSGNEHRVVDWFAARLDDSWELFVRPHLNGLRPDLVAFHAQHGLGLFDVIGSARDRAARPRGEHPLERQSRMRDFSVCLLSPGFADAVAEDYARRTRVTCGIIDPGRPTNLIRDAWAREMRNYSHFQNQGRFYYPVVGDDALAGWLAAVYPRWNSNGNPLTETQANQLRSWLEDPEPGPISLMMSDAQQKIARQWPPTGFRKIRGAAGSGKSQVLAARAAEISAQGKDVLVLTYNITAWHPIRNMALRWPVSGRNLAGRVTWLHFHEWCYQRMAEAGLSANGDDEWDGASGNDFYDYVIPNRCREALAIAPVQYDAILIDEAHDFLPGWWEAARLALRPGGEAMLAADSTQDLFHPGIRWIDSPMEGSGFPGEWIDAPFRTGYRLPAQLIPHVQRFVETYRTRLGVNLAPPEQRAALDHYDPFRTEWMHIGERGDLVTAGVSAIIEAREAARLEGLEDRDIAVLCQSRDLGIRLRVHLAQRGIPVQHVFGTGSTGRLLKIAFSEDDPRIKAAPLKSFRGWQARKVILLLEQAATDEQLREIYVGLTRVKMGGRGASLTVISQPAALLDFALGWPNFVDARPMTKPEPSTELRPAGRPARTVPTASVPPRTPVIPPDPFEGLEVDDIPF